jgi:RHS repeat-associated protein
VGSLGHVTDQSTGGLIYMQARYYDPGMGRFVSEDPKCSGMNWYIYCSDNPTNSVDANGKALTPIGNTLALVLLCAGLTAAVISFILFAAACPEFLAAIAPFVCVCAACAEVGGAEGVMAAVISGVASWIMGNTMLLATGGLLAGIAAVIIGYEFAVNDALTEPADAPGSSPGSSGTWAVHYVGDEQ